MLRTLVASLKTWCGQAQLPPPASRPRRDDLPPELVHLIIDLSLLDVVEQHRNSAEWKHRLLSYCLVNRTWRAYAQPLLYRSPILSERNQISRFTKLWKGDRRLAGLIKSIAIDELHRPPREDMDLYLLAPDRLPRLIAACPQLESLYIWSCWMDQKVGLLGCSHFRALCLHNVNLTLLPISTTKGYKSYTFPHVTSLLLHNTSYTGDPTFFLSPATFPSVTSLLIFRSVLQRHSSTLRQPDNASLLRPQLSHLSTSDLLGVELSPDLETLTIDQGATCSVPPTVMSYLKSLKALRYEGWDPPSHPAFQPAQWLVKAVNWLLLSHPQRQLETLYLPDSWQDSSIWNGAIMPNGQRLADSVETLRNVCEEGGVKVVWEPGRVLEHQARERNVFKKFLDQVEIAEGKKGGETV